MTSPKRPASQTPPSTPRLSEAARHFVLPKGIVTTGFPSVEATCLKLKIVFDPWQRGAGTAILGKREDSLYAADAIVISIPRQVGKTFLIGSIIFALCIQQPGLLCVWTAHRYVTASETFDSMKAMAQRPELKPHIVRAVAPAGNGIIEFRNGSRILFGARERGFGRGIPKISVVVLDEAQILGQNAIDDMIPATNQAENPLIFYIGTPPKPSDPSEVFVNLRDEAISGESEDTLYIEFSADEDADPKDREQWAKANPSYPHRTTARAMLRMVKNLGMASFLREGLGIWDSQTAAGVFSTGAWARCGTTEPPGDPASFGIAADLDQSWLSLGAASDTETPHLAATLRSRFDTERAHFVAETKRLAQDLPVAIDKKGPAAPIIPDLEEAGVVLIQMGLDEKVQADVDLRDAVETRAVRHANYPELNAAVDAATWRSVGESRRAIGRRTGDVSMLEAVALARHVLANNYDPLDSIG
jgi:hypothetical protein